MKKYKTPTISIRIFNEITATTDASVIADVPGIADIAPENKRRVKLSEMEAITKFAF